ncbi:MAG: hypothetical protein Q4C95_09955, partial [Planctomycetia bacterium]|nr:hypothetical protein [Planctomycetia bacterium]
MTNLLDCVKRLWNKDSRSNYCSKKHKKIQSLLWHHAILEQLEDRQLLALSALEIGGVSYSASELAGTIEGDNWTYETTDPDAGEGTNTLILKNIILSGSIHAQGNLTLDIQGIQNVISTGANENAIQVQGDLLLSSSTGATDAKSRLELTGGLNVSGNLLNEIETPSTSDDKYTLVLDGKEINYYVGNATDLSSAFSSASTDRDYTILIHNSFTCGSTLRVGENKRITLVSSGNHTLTRSGTTSAMFSVYGTSLNTINKDTVLNLGLVLGMGTSTLTIDGGAVWTNISGAANSGIRANSPIIYNSGILNIYSGITLQNNHNTSSNTAIAGAVFVNGKDANTNNPKTVEEAENGNGGAIFNMYGGTIQSCYGIKGAGVNVLGEFNFYDGLITNNYAYNEAGGVRTRGIFNMSGGTISYCGCVSMEPNADSTSAKGGGVHVSTNGYMHMTGGTITQNYSYYRGGGIYMGGNGSAYTFLEGGEITYNRALQGGGISINSALHLSDHIYIAYNDAYSLNQDGTYASIQQTENTLGSGIYCYYLQSMTKIPAIHISGSAVVDSSNDVYIEDFMRDSDLLIPVRVDGELTSDGICMMIAGYGPDYIYYDGDNARNEITRYTPLVEFTPSFYKDYAQNHGIDDWKTLYPLFENAYYYEYQTTRTDKEAIGYKVTFNGSTLFSGAVNCDPDGYYYLTWPKSSAESTNPDGTYSITIYNESSTLTTVTLSLTDLEGKFDLYNLLTTITQQSKFALVSENWELTVGLKFSSAANTNAYNKLYEANQSSNVANQQQDTGNRLCLFDQNMYYNYHARVENIFFHSLDDALNYVTAHADKYSGYQYGKEGPDGIIGTDDDLEPAYIYLVHNSTLAHAHAMTCDCVILSETNETYLEMRFKYEQDLYWNTLGYSNYDANGDGVLSPGEVPTSLLPDLTDKDEEYLTYKNYQFFNADISITSSQPLQTEEIQGFDGKLYTLYTLDGTYTWTSAADYTDYVGSTRYWAIKDEYGSVLNSGSSVVDANGKIALSFKNYGLMFYDVYVGTEENNLALKAYLQSADGGAIINDSDAHGRIDGTNITTNGTVSYAGQPITINLPTGLTYSYYSAHLILDSQGFVVDTLLDSNENTLKSYLIRHEENLNPDYIFYNDGYLAERHTTYFVPETEGQGFELYKNGVRRNTITADSDILINLPAYIPLSELDPGESRTVDNLTVEMNSSTSYNIDINGSGTLEKDTDVNASPYFTMTVTEGELTQSIDYSAVGDFICTTTNSNGFTWNKTYSYVITKDGSVITSGTVRTPASDNSQYDESTYPTAPLDERQLSFAIPNEGAGTYRLIISMTQGTAPSPTANPWLTITLDNNNAFTINDNGNPDHGGYCTFTGLDTETTERYLISSLTVNDGAANFGGIDLVCNVTYTETQPDQTVKTYTASNISLNSFQKYTLNSCTFTETSYNANGQTIVSGSFTYTISDFYAQVTNTTNPSDTTTLNTGLQVTIRFENALLTYTKESGTITNISITAQPEVTGSTLSMETTTISSDNGNKVVEVTQASLSTLSFVPDTMTFATPSDGITLEYRGEQFDVTHAPFVINNQGKLQISPYYSLLMTGTLTIAYEAHSGNPVDILLTYDVTNANFLPDNTGDATLRLYDYSSQVQLPFGKYYSTRELAIVAGTPDVDFYCTIPIMTSAFTNEGTTSSFVNIVTNMLFPFVLETSGDYTINISDAFSFQTNPYSLLRQEILERKSNKSSLTDELSACIQVENNANLTLGTNSGTSLFLVGYRHFSLDGPLFLVTNTDRDDQSTLVFNNSVHVLNFRSALTPSTRTIDNVVVTTYIGGVVTLVNGNFIMNGGSITECCGYNAGAVALNPGTTFTFNGGIIENNTGGASTTSGHVIYLSGAGAIFNSGGSVTVAKTDIKDHNGNIIEPIIRNNTGKFGAIYNEDVVYNTISPTYDSFSITWQDDVNANTQTSYLLYIENDEGELVYQDAVLFHELYDSLRGTTSNGEWTYNEKTGFYTYTSHIFTKERARRYRIITVDSRVSYIPRTNEVLVYAAEGTKPLTLKWSVNSEDVENFQEYTLGIDDAFYDKFTTFGLQFVLIDGVATATIDTNMGTCTVITNSEGDWEFTYLTDATNWSAGTHTYYVYHTQDELTPVPTNNDGTLSFNWSCSNSAPVTPGTTNVFQIELDGIWYDSFVRPDDLGNGESRIFTGGDHQGTCTVTRNGDTLNFEFVSSKNDYSGEHIFRAYEYSRTDFTPVDGKLYVRWEHDADSILQTPFEIIIDTVHYDTVSAPDPASFQNNISTINTAKGTYVVTYIESSNKYVYAYTPAETYAAGEDHFYVVYRSDSLNSSADAVGSITLTWQGDDPATTGESGVYQLALNNNWIDQITIPDTLPVGGASYHNANGSWTITQNLSDPTKWDYSYVLNKEYTLGSTYSFYAQRQVLQEATPDENGKLTLSQDFTSGIDSLERIFIVIDGELYDSFLPPGSETVITDGVAIETQKGSFTITYDQNESVWRYEYVPDKVYELSATPHTYSFFSFLYHIVKADENGKLNFVWTDPLGNDSTRILYIDIDNEEYDQICIPEAKDFNYYTATCTQYPGATRYEIYINGQIYDSFDAVTNIGGYFTDLDKGYYFDGTQYLYDYKDEPNIEFTWYAKAYNGSELLYTTDVLTLTTTANNIAHIYNDRGVYTIEKPVNESGAWNYSHTPNITYTPGSAHTFNVYHDSANFVHGTVTTTEGGGVTVNWNAVDTAVKYKLEFYLGQDPESVVEFTIDAPSEELDITYGSDVNLLWSYIKEGQNRTFTARHINTSYILGSDYRCVVTPLDANDQPITAAVINNTELTAAKAGQMLLTWTDAPNYTSNLATTYEIDIYDANNNVVLTSYVVYASTGRGDNYVYTYNDPDNDGIGTYFLSLSNLTLGSEYTWQIRALVSEEIKTITKTTTAIAPVSFSWEGPMAQIPDADLSMVYHNLVLEDAFRFEEAGVTKYGDNGSWVFTISDNGTPNETYDDTYTCEYTTYLDYPASTYQIIISTHQNASLNTAKESSDPVENPDPVFSFTWEDIDGATASTQYIIYLENEVVTRINYQTDGNSAYQASDYSITQNYQWSCDYNAETGVYSFTVSSPTLKTGSCYSIKVLTDSHKNVPVNAINVTPPLHSAGSIINLTWTGNAKGATSDTCYGIYVINPNTHNVTLAGTVDYKTSGENSYGSWTYDSSTDEYTYTTQIPFLNGNLAHYHFYITTIQTVTPDNLTAAWKVAEDETEESVYLLSIYNFENELIKTVSIKAKDPDIYSSDTNVYKFSIPINELTNNGQYDITDIYRYSVKHTKPQYFYDSQTAATSDAAPLSVTFDDATSPSGNLFADNNTLLGVYINNILVDTITHFGTTGWTQSGNIWSISTENGTCTYDTVTCQYTYTTAASYPIGEHSIKIATVVKADENGQIALTWNDYLSSSPDDGRYFLYVGQKYVGRVEKGTHSLTLNGYTPDTIYQWTLLTDVSIETNVELNTSMSGTQTITWQDFDDLPGDNYVIEVNNRYVGTIERFDSRYYNSSLELYSFTLSDSNLSREEIFQYTIH